MMIKDNVMNYGLYDLDVEQKSILIGSCAVSKQRNEANMKIDNMKPRLRYCGFTLIELLVILSMIMFLASLLVPALNQVNQVTMRSTCSRNESQIFYMSTLYANDNNGYVLPARFNNSARNFPLQPYDWDYWPTLLAINYLDHVSGDGYADELRCPGEDSSGKVWMNYGINVQSKSRNGVSAGPAHSNPWHWQDGVYHKITDFRKTSETVFVMDWKLQVMFDWVGGDAPGKALSIDRHETGVNALFLDGHIDFIDQIDVPCNPNVDTFWTGLE